MRLYFQDPTGQRLAIDTNRQEWAATYAKLPTEIKDGHTFIFVDSSEDLEKIENEIDFNGWNYNKDLAEDRRATDPEEPEDPEAELKPF